MAKTYLGDGAYVDEWNNGIVLTAENGVSVTNQIFLEPLVITALERYIAARRKMIADAMKAVKPDS